jgi:hypothetical protein
MLTTELNGPAGADTPNGLVKSHNSVKSYLTKMIVTPYSVKLPTERKRIVYVIERKARQRIARAGPRVQSRRYCTSSQGRW